MFNEYNNTPDPDCTRVYCTYAIWYNKYNVVAIHLEYNFTEVILNTSEIKLLEIRVRLFRLHVSELLPILKSTKMF